MPSSFSTDLKLELMVTGENAGTWGTKTNTNLNLLQQAIAGFQSISIAGGAQTTALTMDNAAISNARNAVIKLTGTITGNQIVTVPSGIEKTYIVSNGTTGAFTVEFKTASGTGPTFSTTDKGIKILFADGTNIVDVNANFSASSFPQINDSNGNEEIKFTTTASAVNELTIANAATGNSPTISATGSDTNVGINLTPKGTGGIVLPAGAVGTPALTTSGDLNTGIFFPSADTIAFTEGGSEAMRITSSGNVGIGLTPSQRFQVGFSTGADQLAVFRDDNVYTPNGGVVMVNRYNDTTDIGGIKISSGTATSGFITFHTGGTTERMKIESGGNVAIANTAIPDVGNNSNTGFGVQGTAGPGYTAIARDSSTALNVARQSNDGVIIGLWQGGTEEGTISVSGATVSYNGFTGSHWSRFIGDEKPDVLRGTVMESLDQMTDWYNVEFEVSTTEKDKDGNDVVKTTTQKKPYALKANEQEGDIITYAWEKKDEEGNNIIEQVQATIVKQKDVKHVMSKISDTVEAKNVYGVFSAWDNDDLINNDFYVASVGSYVVRIKAGQVVAKGDLLQSNGDGTAKVQADDIIRASTFAKVLSNTVIQTYEDGSFIVPCSLMC